MLAKRLEVLRDLAPDHTKIAILTSSAVTVQKFEAEFVEQNNLIVLKVDGGTEPDETEYERQFDAAAEKGARALLVSADPFFTNRRNLIARLSAKHALAAVYPWRQYAEAGGLASYGPSITEAYRQIGRYAGRILNGAKPADLPVQMPTKFELVINLKTAKTLGLTVSPWLLARADEVIK
jgi:putative ABC transport system substrate-binding protein